MAMEQYLISVDLGGSKVAAALGLRSVEGETIVVDAVSKPMQGFTRGEVDNIEHVTNAIREAVGELEARNGVKADEVWVGLSGRHIICADNSGFVFVGSPDGEITEKDVEKLHDNMANVQAPDGKVIISRIPQHYKVDANETLGSPVGRFGHRLETTYSFVLGGKVVIERITKAFKRADIPAVEFVASGVASASVAATEEEKESGVIVIDFGAGATDICIYQNKVVRYVASIPFGSAAINKDIRTTAIPEGTIETLKTACGYATASAIPESKLNKAVRINAHSPHQKYKEITYRDLTTIIESRMLDIIDFVNAEIKASGYHNRIPAGIVLTGGGSKLAGIDTLFRERTGYEVRLGSAESDISAESMDGFSAPELATAIGLLNIGMSAKNTPASDYVKPISKAPVADVEREEEIATPAIPAAPAAPTTPTTPTTPTVPATPQVPNNTKEDTKEDTTPEQPAEKKSGKEKEEKEPKKRGWWKKVENFFFGGDIVDDEIE